MQIYKAVMFNRNVLVSLNVVRSVQISRAVVTPASCFVYSDEQLCARKTVATSV